MLATKGFELNVPHTAIAASIAIERTFASPSRVRSGAITRFFARISVNKSSSAFTAASITAPMGTTVTSDGSRLAALRRNAASAAASSHTVLGAASSRAEYAASSSHTNGALEAAIVSSNAPTTRLLRYRTAGASRAAEAHQSGTGQIIVVSARAVDTGRVSARNAANLLQPRHSPGLAVEAMNMRPRPIGMAAVHDGFSIGFEH